MLSNWTKKLSKSTWNVKLSELLSANVWYWMTNDLILFFLCLFFAIRRHNIDEIRRGKKKASERSCEMFDIPSMQNEIYPRMVTRTRVSSSTSRDWEESGKRIWKWKLQTILYFILAKKVPSGFSCSSIFDFPIHFVVCKDLDSLTQTRGSENLALLFSCTISGSR